MVKITRNIVKKIARNMIKINVVKNTRNTVKKDITRNMVENEESKCGRNYLIPQVN